MGTSANLGIICGDKQWVVHTSYDATPSNVFSSLGASIAACGLDAVRTQVQQATLMDVGRQNDDEVTKRSVAGGFAPYLAACQARGNEPFGLMGAIRYPYGAPDFAHGGVMTIMGPQAINDSGWGSVETADFLLDLDQGTLVYKQYACHTDYSAGRPAQPVFTLDLTQVDGLNPDQVFLALQQIGREHVEDFVQRVAANAQEITTALDQAKAGACVAPDYSQWRNSDDNVRATLTGDQGPGEHGAGVHTFLAHPDDAVLLRMLSGVLLRAGEQVPALARPDILRMDLTPDQYGAVSLFVDFSAGFANKEEGEAVQWLMTRLQDPVAQMGMGCRFEGGGVSTGRSQGGGFASVSVGGEEEDFPDDILDGIYAPSGIPSSATPVRTRARLLADAQACAADMGEDATRALVFEKVVARATFDAEMMAVIPPHISLSAEDLSLSNYLMVDMAGLEEAVLPGARRTRFLALPAADRQQLLSDIPDLARYVFLQEMGVSDADLAAPRAPRP